ncbi:MAG TPA: hypothetical protein VLY23_19780 [Candidatus Acidoferrum sp.]|nr:hypothetical protein [Candidatus Acidoferrum sp.]
MRRIALVCGLIISVAVLCQVATLRAQQASTEKAAAPAAMQEPKPSPEMDRMKFLVGTWDLEGEYLKTPLTGEGGKQTGWYKAQVGPGGFSIIADFEADSPIGKEIGHQLFAWDPNTGTYTTVTIGNFPGLLIGKAHWEGENLVTEVDFKMGDAAIHNRAVYSHTTNKNIQIEESYQMGDAPMQLMWKATATRK